jgi:hypothetical protein
MTMPEQDRAALLQGDYSPDWKGWIEHFEREDEPVFVPETRRLYVDIQPTHNTSGMTEAEYRAMWRRSLIRVVAGIILLSIVAAITN